MLVKIPPRTIIPGRTIIRYLKRFHPGRLFQGGRLFGSLEYVPNNRADTLFVPLKENPSLHFFVIFDQNMLKDLFNFHAYFSKNVQSARLFMPARLFGTFRVVS